MAIKSFLDYSFLFVYCAESLMAYVFTGSVRVESNLRISVEECKDAPLTVINFVASTQGTVSGPSVRFYILLSNVCTRRWFLVISPKGVYLLTSATCVHPLPASHPHQSCVLRLYILTVFLVHLSPTVVLAPLPV